MESTCVISRVVIVLQKSNNILSTPGFLPEGIELVQDPMAITVMMGLTGGQYFSADRYTCIDF